MTIQEIKEPYNAAPFQPFDLVLTNGSAVHVAHPEFMAFSPRGDTVYVSESDGLRRIDVRLVIALKAYERSKRQNKKK